MLSPSSHPPPVPAAEGFAAALVVLLALAAAVAFCFAPLRATCLVPPAPAAGAGVLSVAGVVAVLPLAGGWPLWAACTVTGVMAVAGLVGSARLDRFTEPKLVVAISATGAALAATASGWALASEAATLVWLAVLALAGGVAATIAGRREFRLGFTGLASAAFLAEVVAVTASGGGALHHCGFALALAAGAVVAAGAHWPRQGEEGRVLEVGGIIGIAVGAALAATIEPWLAVALSFTVAWLSVAGASEDHRWHLWGAGWVAVGATWAWLGAADVSVVEAYTLPAATAALVSGAVVQRRSPELSSWVTWAPGLLIGLVPTLALAVTETDLARRLAVTAAGFAVVVAGARAQRQAPLVFGSLTLVTIAVDALAPVATELPRWLTIGTVGVLLLWLGATAERRVAEFRRLRQRFEDLEPEGWSPFLRRFGDRPEGGTTRVAR